MQHAVIKFHVLVEFVCGFFYVICVKCKTILTISALSLLSSSIWLSKLLLQCRNMVPVPVVVLYLAKLFNYISSRSKTGERWIEKVLENTRRKAAPIQEFQWLGLMLFVAVPFPGTGYVLLQPIFLSCGVTPSFSVIVGLL